MNKEILCSENSLLLDNQKKETAKRLRILVDMGLHPVVAENLEQDLISVSDCQIHNYPVLFDFSDDNNIDPKWFERVKEVSDEYGIYVYHIIHCYTSFGELLNLLYVTSYEEEWEREREELKEGYPVSYVINLNIPHYSEFGSIGIKTAMGGIVRTE